MRRTLVPLLAVALAGCAPKLIHLAVDPADVDTATAMLAPGTSTLKGSAFMRKYNGDVVSCAGTQAYLIPATPSTTSEMRRIFGGDKGYVERGADPILHGGKLVVAPEPNRPVTCNVQGFFTFANIRPGKWYVMTSVEWLMDGQPQGGTLLGSAEITAGQEMEIVLSQ